MNVTFVTSNLRNTREFYLIHEYLQTRMHVTTGSINWSGSCLDPATSWIHDMPNGDLVRLPEAWKGPWVHPITLNAPEIFEHIAARIVWGSNGDDMQDAIWCEPQEGGVGMQFECPWCARSHYHGRGDGHRSSHCAMGSTWYAPDYQLKQKTRAAIEKRRKEARKVFGTDRAQSYSWLLKYYSKTDIKRVQEFENRIIKPGDDTEWTGYLY